MAQQTIYAKPSESATIDQYDTTYSNVTSGLGTARQNLTSTADTIGQWLIGGIYTNRFLFIGFDLSVIPAGSVITSATLVAEPYTAQSGITGTCNAILYDYGPTQETGDYLTSTQFNAETVVASLTKTSQTVGVDDTFTSITLASDLVVGQVNRMILGSANYAAETAPTGLEDFYRFVTGDGSVSTARPRLIIDYDTIEPGLFMGANF